MFVFVSGSADGDLLVQPDPGSDRTQRETGGYVTCVGHVFSSHVICVGREMMRKRKRLLFKLQCPFLLSFFC